jgi:hypothetical protein
VCVCVCVCGVVSLEEWCVYVCERESVVMTERCVALPSLWLVVKSEK